MTVPAGQVAGLPIGMSFMGHAAFSEERLLALAYALESATHARKPPHYLATVPPSNGRPCIECAADPRFAAKRRFRRRIMRRIPVATPSPGENARHHPTYPRPFCRGETSSERSRTCHSRPRTDFGGRFAMVNHRKISSSIFAATLCALGTGACGQGSGEASSEATQAASVSVPATGGKGTPAGHGVRGATNDEPMLTPTPSPTTTFTEHGGPVMTGTTSVYYVWYGNWAGDTAPTILSDFALSIGGSTYWAINTQYADTSGNRPANAVSYGGSTTDAYSKGKSISDGDIQSIVSNAIKSKKLPSDANAVYFVLTSADVTTPGFCTTMCGYHDHFTYGGVDIGRFSSSADAVRSKNERAASLPATENDEPIRTTSEPTAWPP